MQEALIWDPALADYDLGDAHPLNPLRLTLSLELMQAFGLLGPDVVIKPRPATENELLLVHTIGYIEAVREASDWGFGTRMAMGLGTEDNPVYPGMHDIAALTCGSTMRGIEEVLAGRVKRTFAIAGGMHHAHRSRAAGFSVYNDAAVGIAVARKADPDLKVLYIDIDAHHGDGVQEAFAGSAEVLTISIHESGLYAFPGTGFPGECGYGPGEGFAANVPLPAYATDECFEVAFDEVVVPLARAFGPDIIVAQLGVDAHHADPQTELGLTLPGYRRLVRGIIGLADELCDGRLAALGGRRLPRRRCGATGMDLGAGRAWWSDTPGRGPGRLARTRSRSARLRAADEHGCPRYLRVAGRARRQGHGAHPAACGGSTHGGLPASRACHLGTWFSGSWRATRGQ